MKRYGVLLLLASIVLGCFIATRLFAQLTQAGSIVCDAKKPLIDVDRCEGSTTLAPGNLSLCVERKAERVVLLPCMTPDGLQFTGWAVTAFQVPAREVQQQK